MKLERIRADHAVHDFPLWVNIRRGKKTLLWRIGNRWYSVRDLEKTGPLIAAYLDGDLNNRRIKEPTLLTVIRNQHPYYAGQAGELLYSLCQATNLNLHLTISLRRIWNDFPYATNDFYYWFEPLYRQPRINFTVESQQFDTDGIDKLAFMGTRLIQSWMEKLGRQETNSIASEDLSNA